MKARVWTWLMVLPLLCGLAKADVYWYTDRNPIAPSVRSYDSGTNTFGAPVGITPGPLVDVGYAVTSPVNIDIYNTVSGVSPIACFGDTPFVCIVDIDPASATYNTVIQTINMTDASVGSDTPGVYWVAFHPTGIRIYAGCWGGGSTIPSVRVAHVISGPPSTEYGFDWSLPSRILTADTGGEFEVLPDAPYGPGARHLPLGMDVNPLGTKLYFACHWEEASTFHSGIHGFTLDGSGDWASTLSVATAAASAPSHPFFVRFSPSGLPFSAGGGRALVSCSREPDDEAWGGFPPPPDPGFVLTVNADADSSVGRVTATVPPPNIDPSTFDPLTTPAFRTPRGIDWTSAGGDAFVADLDQTIPPGAVDGIIAVRVIPGIAPSADVAFDYFDDPTASPADTDPVYKGVAVDNDNEEIVFCDVTGSIVVYNLDGTVKSTLATPGQQPSWIVVQSGTGSSGGGGGGGGSSGSGASDTNDNGGNFSDDDDDNGSSGRSSHKKKCGLTGFEIPVLLAGWIALRKAGKAVKS